MRRWLRIASAAVAAVSDRPTTWLAGGLVWLVTIGWVAFVVGVAKAPTVSDLTFLGARIFGSGLWPWNAIAIGAGVLALVAVAFTLAAIGEAALLDLVGPRRRGLRGAVPILAVASVAALPAAFGAFLVAIVLVAVAPTEFSSPDVGGGPIVRTLLRIAPVLVVAVLATTVGGAVHAAAVRLVHDRGEEVADALRGSVRLLWSAGWPALLHVVATGALRVGMLVIAAILLRVLWAPVGTQLDLAGLDVPTAALLVGFVAIWLCLVLAGGALQAWASAGWSVLVTGRVGDGRPDRRREEHPIDR